MFSPGTIKLNEYFKSKTILRDYLFYTKIFNTTGKEVKIFEIGTIKSIKIPIFSDKIEIDKEMYGSFSRSYAKYKNEGIDFSLEMVEDSKNTVDKFLMLLTKNIVTTDGLLNYPDETKLKRIQTRIYEPNNKEFLMEIDFKDCLFKGADELTYDYANNGNIIYNVNFVCDFFETKYRNELTTENDEETFIV